MIKKSKLLSAAVVATAALWHRQVYADTMNTPNISAMSIMNGLKIRGIWHLLVVVTCFIQKNVKVYL